ncbi:MAG: hypothetical protein J6U44_03190 [Paludibacteraceae bacterium]|nr:hypothetical protein [Paludibacteraceae bacterium]MBO7316154.1 hypothetical protein [Paludibacteraceae bacterium]
MKKVSVITFALLLGAMMSLQAQCPKRPECSGKPMCEKPMFFSPETKAMMRADFIANELNLSKKEKEKVISLLTKEEQKKADLCQEMKDAEAETEKKLEEIIGTEKMSILKAKKEKQRPFCKK